MTQRPFTREDLQRLKQWDTATICNGLEVVAPARRAIGFTTQPLLSLYPKMPPIVGLARVGTISSREPARSIVAQRADWYDYVGTSDLPTIVVVQDIDSRPGYGAFWGEVHTTVHRRLGALGCVTNGSFRDVGMCDPVFQVLGGQMGPSHAHVHLIDFGKPVDVFGMQACHDDVIHADLHGAVVIPAECVKSLPDAIYLVSRREKVILDVVNGPDFSLAKLRDAIARAGEIH